jgi:hypothetical protein
MGYTRRRAVLCEIERLCATALSVYSDCVTALQSGDAHRFWRSLELLSAATDQLDCLVWAGDTAEWLGISAASVLHRTRSRRSPGSFDGIPLPLCGSFLDSDGLPALLAAVAELGRVAEERIADLRHIV